MIERENYKMRNGLINCFPFISFHKICNTNAISSVVSVVFISINPREAKNGPVFLLSAVNPSSLVRVLKPIHNTHFLDGWEEWSLINECLFLGGVEEAVVPRLQRNNPSHSPFFIVPIVWNQLLARVHFSSWYNSTYCERNTFSGF